MHLFRQLQRARSIIRRCRPKKKSAEIVRHRLDPSGMTVRGASVYFANESFNAACCTGRDPPCRKGRSAIQGSDGAKRSQEPTHPKVHISDVRRYASKGCPDLIGAQPLPLFDNLIDAPRTIHPPICTARRCPSPKKRSVSLGEILAGARCALSGSCRLMRQKCHRGVKPPASASAAIPHAPPTPAAYRR